MVAVAVAVMSGLFVVVAGASAAGAAAEDGAGYVPLVPCRVVDTRGGGGAFGPGAVRSFRVTGSGPEFGSQGSNAAGCGVPVGAVAVEASITAVAPTATGFTRAWPHGGPVPTATFLNFTKGQGITNTGSVSLATTGTEHLSLFNSGGTTHYVIDVQGYFTGDPSGADYVPVAPCRVVDTRVGGGAMAGGGERSFTVTGTGDEIATQGGKSGGCGIPAGAVAVEASITAVAPTATGFARAWPHGGSVPTATFLNFTKGQAITNTGSVSLATTGTQHHLSLFNSGGTTHYVIDVQGYFTTAAAGARYVPLAPCRVVDTRPGSGALAGGTARSFTVTGSTPAIAAQGGRSGGCGIPTGAVAVEASVTAVAPTATGFARAWPADGAMPTATFLNFTKAQSITNTGSVSLATTGAQQLRLSSSAGTTHYVIDVQGYFTTVTAAPTAPGTPTGVSATAGVNQATVSWTAPASDGGAPITGYVVTPSIGAAAQAPVTFDSTATSQNMTGLTNGTSYTFKVAARNSAGTGAQSTASNAVTPTATTPGAPTGVTATAGVNHATVSWTAPASNGGAAITGYVITPRIGGEAQAAVTFASTATTQTVSGLANGTSYTFTVAAKNSVGTGTSSTASNAVTPDPTAPGAPTGVTAVAGVSRVTLSWNTPASNGGVEITSYVVTPYIGATAQSEITFASTATSQNITGLTNGTSYTFRVAAHNSIGTGAKSEASNAATPAATTPGAPTAVTATAGLNQATVSWTAPTFTGGSALTGYVVTPYIGATAQTPVTFASTATSQNMTGLTNGTSYTFRVAGKNSVGTGTASASSNAVTPTTSAPGAPTGVTAVAGVNEVALSWTAPASNGGAVITGYVVTPYIGATGQPPVTFASAATDQTVTGLTNGTTYTFKVAAHNSVGTGAQSGASNAATPTALTPGAPTAVSTVAGVKNATVSWTAPASTGGSAITGYVVTPYIAGTARTATTFDSNATTQIITPLASGTELSFTVAAINGAGTGPQSAQSNFATPSAFDNAVSVSTGDLHACALLSDGTVRCWGSNARGQLGNASTTDAPRPVTVSGITTATSVVVSGTTSCARLANGTVRCWGNGTSGQLGNGSSTDATTPVTVSGITTATAVSVGGASACAVLADTSVRCWGSNVQGQLGNNTLVSSSTPVVVAGLTTAGSVTSGVDHSCARLSGGSLKCWGDNDDGQLGNGTIIDSRTPVTVAGISSATAVTASARHTCALLSTGGLMCWGDNTFGQLGDSTTTAALSPVGVSGIGSATGISAGLTHTCAVLADGTMACWGHNALGQLGNGTTAGATVPVEVVNIDAAVGSSAGHSSTCTVLSTGTVRCWGNNSSGQLGNGSLVSSPTPRTV
ncbi:MAG: hypothetical protein JWM47_943 [Acidimicrobiales bacterium]|nr:hypothetical protein [Acidimicrobiales bacterium]